MTSLFTIGHSTHDLTQFLRLLDDHAITAIADVRSVPASRYSPHFNQSALRRALKDAGIHYVPLCAELGARPSDPSCYRDGKVQYQLLAQTPAFHRGIDRLIDGASRERIAIMCTEAEPLDCHRTVLISRVLSEREAFLTHVHRDGRTEDHGDAMFRLRQLHQLEEPSLLDTEDELLSEALYRQETVIAYVAAEANHHEESAP